MRRWLAVAALGAAFLTLPAWGQRRAGVSRGFTGHAGFAGRGSTVGGRGPTMANRSPAFGRAQRGGVRFGTRFNHPISSPFFFHRHHRFFRSWPYAGYYGYPYYSYPWYYGDNSYSADSYQNYQPSDYSNAYLENSSDQQAEISRLEDEVDRLRAEGDARESRPSGTPPASLQAESQATQLVFRDQRTEEVRNYAIVGQTFWIFSEQRARKIPLAQLDIPATKKANEDRGIEFQVPE